MNRCHDPERVNHLAGVEFDEAVIAEPLHVFLEEGDNLGCFIWRGPHTYEIHLAFTARGRASLRLFERMVATMRDEYGARMLWAAIPVADLMTRKFARLVGFRSEGIHPFADGEKEVFVSEERDSREQCQNSRAEHEHALGECLFGSFG